MDAPRLNPPRLTRELPRLGPDYVNSALTVLELYKTDDVRGPGVVDLDALEAAFTPKETVR